MEDNDLAAALKRLRENNEEVVSLNFNKQPLTATAMEMIGNALETNTTCSMLQLLCCGVDSDGVVALKKALVKENSKLKVLFLGCNTIGNEGVKVLKEV